MLDMAPLLNKPQTDWDIITMVFYIYNNLQYGFHKYRTFIKTTMHMVWEMECLYL